jgi:hypothetical protein
MKDESAWTWSAWWAKNSVLRLTCSTCFKLTEKSGNGITIHFSSPQPASSLNQEGLMLNSLEKVSLAYLSSIRHPTPMVTGSLNVWRSRR